MVTCFHFSFRWCPWLKQGGERKTCTGAVKMGHSRVAL